MLSHITLFVKGLEVFLRFLSNSAATTTHFREKSKKPA